MNTYQKTSFLSEIASGEPIPAAKRAYLQERVRYSFYSYVIDKFLERERTHNLTRAQLARRIGRQPEVISRLLGSPGNWTIDTITDLLLGIAAEELLPTSASLLNRPKRNFSARDSLKAERIAPAVTGTNSDEKIEGGGNGSNSQTSGGATQLVAHLEQA